MFSGHRIQLVTEALAQRAVRVAPARQASVEVTHLTQAKGRLQIGEAKVGPDAAIEVRAAPLEVAVIDVLERAIHDAGVARHERSALSGRHDLGHAERVGADVAEHSGRRAVMTMTERAGRILDQRDPTRGAQASDFDEPAACVA